MRATIQTGAASCTGPVTPGLHLSPFPENRQIAPIVSSTFHYQSTTRRADGQTADGLGYDDVAWLRWRTVLVLLSGKLHSLILLFNHRHYTITIIQST